MYQYLLASPFRRPHQPVIGLSCSHELPVIAALSRRRDLIFQSPRQLLKRYRPYDSLSSSTSIKPLLPRPTESLQVQADSTSTRS